MDLGSTLFQRIEQIQKIIESLDVTLVSVPMRLSPAVCFKSKELEAIAINCSTPLEEYEFCATHELMHLTFDQTYRIEDTMEVKIASEDKVNNYTIQKLFPLQKLEEALEEIGFPTLNELARCLGTTPRIVKLVLEHYKQDRDYMTWMADYCQCHDTSYLADELEHFEG